VANKKKEKKKGETDSNSIVGTEKSWGPSRRKRREGEKEVTRCFLSTSFTLEWEGGRTGKRKAGKKFPPSLRTQDNEGGGGERPGSASDLI